MVRILFIEDDKVNRMAFKRFVGRENLPYDYTIATSATEAKEYLSAEKFDVVLCDYLLGDGTALDLLEIIEETPAIIITGSGDEHVAVEAMKAGAVDYLIKDPQSNYLITLPSTVENALQRKRNENELRHYRQHLEELIAERTAELEQANQQLQQEITERRQAEEAETEQKALLEAIYRNAPLVLMAVDTERRVQQVNGFATQFAGRPIEEMLGLRGGEALRCLHALDAPEGCGFGEYCQHCLIRNTVLDTLENGTNHLQVEAPFLLSKDGEINELTLLVSTTSLTMKDKRMALVTMQDVTERVRAEAALRESEEKFRNLFNSIRDAILVADTSRQIIDCNPAFSELFGYSLEEIRGQQTHAVYAKPEQFKQMGEALREHTGDPNFLYVIDYRKKSGQVFPGETNVFYLKDQAGDTTGFIGLIRDISKRMQAESQLKAEKEWSERLINYAPNIVVGLQEGSKIAVFNRFAERLTGYKAEEVIGKEWIGTFIPEELRGDIYQAWEDIVANQLIDHHFENEIITKSGERRLIEWSNTIITENGEFQMILSLGVDITERVHAEQALRESEEKYRTLVNSTLQGVVIARSHPVRLVFANPAMAQISGYPPERLVEMGPDELAKLIYEADRQRFFINFQKRIQGENVPQANEYRIVTNDGTVKWVALYSSQIQYRNEPATLTTFMDITARKQAEERLEEYTDQLEDMVAERAQELRDAQDKLIRQERLAALGQIAGSMGHELRNPLGVIHNASYYLKMKLADADEDIQESIEMIDEETQNASKIIADLLDFGRTQAADPALVNVSEVVNAVIERNPPPGDVTLRVDVPENLPPVFVDELQLKQVLTNLVTNAYQAMPEGGELSVESGPRTAGSVRIKVSDTGTGIPPENLKKIFEPLFTTKARGIGLGLAICKKLVAANDGKIEVESQWGEGTTFTLDLPQKKGVAT